MASESDIVSLTESSADADMQTDTCRWFARIHQTHRMFGHHRSNREPEEAPDKIGVVTFHAELEEFAELERKADVI